MLTSLVVSPIPVQAAAEVNGCTRYAAVAGNDAHDGLTTATVWRTLQKAANVAGTGDVVCVSLNGQNPLLNAGLRLQSGPVDIDNQPRISYATIDLGADEVQ